MDMLNEIKADLVDESVPLSTVLRKAKVLAYQLDSDDLKHWVSQELGGYDPEEDVPHYRILPTRCIGTWTDGYRMIRNYGVPLAMIDDEKLRSLLTRVPVLAGIRAIEETAGQESLRVTVSADVTGWVNSFVPEESFGYMDIAYTLGPGDFEQILDTVRNRLLDFILELDATWNIEEESPQATRLSELIQMYILKGGNVSIFDQRGQEVTYQYNAAGDISVASAQTGEELISELGKLRRELMRARELGALEEDTAVKTEYHLIEAIEAAEKEDLDEKSFREHIGKAKGLLEDTAAAVGLVTALVKVMEAAGRIF